MAARWGSSSLAGGAAGWFFARGNGQGRLRNLPPRLGAPLCAVCVRIVLILLGAAPTPLPGG